MYAAHIIKLAHTWCYVEMYRYVCLQGDPMDLMNAKVHETILLQLNLTRLNLLLACFAMCLARDEVKERSGTVASYNLSKHVSHGFRDIHFLLFLFSPGNDSKCMTFEKDINH